MTVYWEDTPEYACFCKLGFPNSVTAIFLDKKDSTDMTFYLEGDTRQYYCPDMRAEIPVYYPVHWPQEDM